jgi:hypothetical protein
MKSLKGSKHPLLEATTVWLVSFVFPPIVYGIFSSTIGFDYLKSHAYIFGTLLEFFLVGFLCILLAVLNNDSRSVFGFTSKGLLKSLTIGLVLIAIHSSIRYALGLPIVGSNLDAFTQSLAQPFPYNIGFSLFCGFAYGPLEVFYIIFLVVRFDRAFDTPQSKIASKGTIVTTLLWALPHILNSMVQGPTAALFQVAKLVVTGLILIVAFKYTKSSIGSMLYWTFANLLG